MKVSISDLNIVSKVVWADLKRVGTITRYARPMLLAPHAWQFMWYGEEWMKLAYDEVTELYAVVDKKVALLNITARLTS